jgi:DNA topoisomerase-6 subunit B
VINNRPTIVECGIAYGGDIGGFKLHRFANKIPLLYDEGSDVAREVVSEVEINKMGISKKEVKEQFSNPDAKSERAVELLPLHIFFHICSTKIPYKTAGKESIASEGELKRYMKACLSDLYRKVSAQIRKELRMKDAQSRLSLYKFYIPLIVNAISESIKVDAEKLEYAFTELAEKHVAGELLTSQQQQQQQQEHYQAAEEEDEITGERISQEAGEEIVEEEIDGEVIKRSKSQIAINAARRKGKRSGSKKGSQTTLDSVLTKKGGKKK